MTSKDMMAQYDLMVSQDGTGNYTTVQAAINAAPAGRTSPYVIFIKNGVYNEKITIPSTKPFIKIIGENVAHVILTYNDYASKLTSCTNTVGTQNSASFSVNANDFSAVNITFINSYGDGSQAVAVLVNADRAIFLNCRLMANQDTVYLKGSGAPRCYFKNCYIDGNVDFIFGSAIALFDSCVVYAKTRPTTASSYITAPNTPNGQAYGFVFRDARLPKNVGTTQYYLSRPWPSPDVAGTRQKTVFLSGRMSSHIKPEGWSIWDANTVTANLYYGEYNSRYFNGSAFDISQRVAWSYQLNATDSATYTQANLFGTWSPCVTVPELCGTQTTSLAVSNFKGVKGALSSQFTWNATWPVNGVAYTLYKSLDNVTFSPVYTYTEPTDSSVNFNYTDLSLPVSGTSWYYYVSASKAGYATEVSDTVTISSKAAIAVNASASLNYCGFSQLLGAPSATQTFTISGTDLNGNIIVTPPSPFEVSADNSNWYNNSNPLVISPVSGTVSLTTIYIRLNSAVIGTFNGTVSVSSTGTVGSSFVVSGVTFGAATSFPLQQWPMTQNNIDSAGTRSYAVLPSTSTLNGLFVSDGTQPTAGPIPAYSSQYGQSLGANIAGNNWSNIGATLNRNYYEQFTVTAAGGSQVRVDSITFLSDFYNTISGIKMGVAFSKNGFSSPADSSEFYSGVGPGGISLALATSGNFLKSFTLSRNDAGPVNRYAISLNGVNGITLNSGETITIRLYWACGSTGTPRFAFLKDVIVKGVVLNPTAITINQFNAVAAASFNKLTFTTTDEQSLHHIEIQKGSSSGKFETIATVQPKLGWLNDYSFNDNNPWELQYYRLKFVEHNRNEIFSNVRLVRRKSNALAIYPNPTQDQVIITHSLSCGKSGIVVYDSKGVMVMSKQVLPGVEKTILSIQQLPAGAYVIKYYDENNEWQSSVIKHR